MDYQDTYQCCYVVYIQKHIMQASTGKPLVIAEMYGKPLNSVYNYAQQVLQQQAKSLGYSYIREYYGKPRVVVVNVKL